MWTLRIFIGLLIGLNVGCKYSRWALKDPDYAAKYDQPPDLLDLPLQAKQASDARHLTGKMGTFYGGAGQSEPVTAGLELGGFYYPVSCLEARGSLALLASSGGENLFYGLNLGVRAQPPTRLAPFAGVGIGLYNGFLNDYYLAETDGRDNDDDGWVDEHGEEETVTNHLVALYPEVGVHYWLSSRARLTASAAYHVTTEGRDHDYLYYGLYFGLLRKPNR